LAPLCFFSDSVYERPQPERHFAAYPPGTPIVPLIPTGLLADDLDQMRHFGHHAANRERILAVDDLVQMGKAQSLDHQPLLGRRAVLRDHPLQLQPRAGRSLYLRGLATLAWHNLEL